MRAKFESGENRCGVLNNRGAVVASFSPNHAADQSACASLCHLEHFQTNNKQRKCTWDKNQFFPEVVVEPTPDEPPPVVDDEPEDDPVVTPPPPTAELSSCRAGQRQKKDLVLHELGKFATKQECQTACQGIQKRRQFCSFGEDGKILTYLVKRKKLEAPAALAELLLNKKVVNFFNGGGGGRRNGGGRIPRVPGLGDLLPGGG